MRPKTPLLVVLGLAGLLLGLGAVYMANMAVLPGHLFPWPLVLVGAMALELVGAVLAVLGAGLAVMGWLMDD